MRTALRAILVGASLFMSVHTGAAQNLRIEFPTDNDALLRGDGPEFYMYTDRNFEGVRSRPWQGGQYGFVRNEQRTPTGIVFTRFHEGVDIQPRYRDGRGEPEDDVRAVDAGRVVYTNRNARQSAYGLYIVVEHQWQGSPYYTLYGHLNEILVREGEKVRQGHRLGRLGYTGVGIDRRRAHLHFEINLLLSERFDAWLRAAERNANNTHGLFNGLNLAGVDVARVYLAQATEGGIDLGEVIQREPVAWKALVPGGTIPELVARYPWMAGGAVPSVPPPAWLVHVANSGLPLRFEPVDQPVTRPLVTYVSPGVREFNHSTNRMLDRRGGAFVLSSRGQRHLDLLTMSAPSIGVPPASTGISSEERTRAW